MMKMPRRSPLFVTLMCISLMNACIWCPNHHHSTSTVVAASFMPHQLPSRRTPCQYHHPPSLQHNLFLSSISSRLKKNTTPPFDNASAATIGMTRKNTVHRTTMSSRTFHSMTSNQDDDDDDDDNEINVTENPLPSSTKVRSSFSSFGEELLKSISSSFSIRQRLSQILDNPQALLEVRLDTTLTSCFVLSRFLWYDLSLPPKTVPQFEIQDIIMLVNVCSSVIVLGMCWTCAGIVSGIFLLSTSEQNTTPQNINNNNNNNNDNDHLLSPLLVFLMDAVPWKKLGFTTLLAGPLWLLIEIGFQWPPSIYYNNNPAAGAVDMGLLLESTTSNSVAAAAYHDVEFLTTTIITGCIGLFATMTIGKVVSKFVN
mmetsp:Transcript_1131/g.1787  ORF Transcript_1131/g.1787 Transcript_1131/m.1787 type:complete len:370 (-) Transcript_1131:145-1254(-)